MPHLPRRALARLTSARPASVLIGLLGTVAIAVMVLLSLQIVGGAASVHNRLLVPSGNFHYPSWMAGPFRGYADRMRIPELNRLLIIIGALYLVVLACARSIPRPVAIGGAVILTVLFALGPPLFSTDIFNYVNYARLGSLHHINPYEHGATAFPADPSYDFTGLRWRHTPTVYGPLFTLLTYAFVPLGVSGAMWALKGVAAASALGCSALIWACAKRLGIRPAPAMLFFALNPLVLLYSVGGGHNDLLMAVLLLGGVLLLIDSRPELAGASVVAAAAIKLTAGLALPFMFVASRLRWRVLFGVVVMALCVIAVGLAVFSPQIGNVIHVLHNHEDLTGKTSIPSWVAHHLGFGPPGRALLQAIFAVGAVALLADAWRRKSWLAATAGALLLLVATLDWLLPWYLVWPLALAPLVRGRWAVAAALVLTALMLAIEINLNNDRAHHKPKEAPVLRAPGPQLPASLQTGHSAGLRQAARSLH